MSKVFRDTQKVVQIFYFLLLQSEICVTYCPWFVLLWLVYHPSQGETGKVTFVSDKVELIVLSGVDHSQTYFCQTLCQFSLHRKNAGVG